MMTMSFAEVNKFVEKGRNDEKVVEDENVEISEEVKFARCREAAEKVREKYTSAYREMLAELSPAQLEPIAALLMEYERHVLQNKEELINEVREVLMRRLQNTLNGFWEEYDVSNRVASLEMLKDQCKQYDGTSWNTEKLDPLQRTLPLRMRYKEMQLKYLQKQLAFQNGQLEDILKVNESERASIHDINQRRVQTKEKIICYSKHMQQKKEQIVEMACEVLDTYDNVSDSAA